MTVRGFSGSPQAGGSSQAYGGGKVSLWRFGAPLKHEWKLLTQSLEKPNMLKTQHYVQFQGVMDP